MFSALKKLVGSDQAPGRDKPIPAGLQSMNQALQRRFAKGVQYNMKIVIRGDRNTGKTTLWHRLQGKKFVEEYIPTQEIQVTSIHWNYKTTDDIVKVEVWDVVDKGKCKKRGDGLKLENDPQEAESEMALDAEFLDVYKNCNGVVMMFDITKQWTFNYILRELPKVPNHVPVCVLGNYRDMGEHRVILPDDVREFIDNLNRPPGSSYFRYAESSMKNSFGLKYLHKFFNIPFLQLQRETLLRQLETNQLDIDATLEELSVQQETEDQNYEIFLEMMEARSRGPATSPLAANGQSPSSGSQSPVVPPGNTSGSSSPGTPQPPPPLPQQSAGHPAAPPESLLPQPPAPLPEPSAAVSPAAAAPPTQKRSIISRLFGTSPAPEAPPPLPDAGITAPSALPSKVQSVEDFVPEDSLDRSFLEDPAPPKERERLTAKGRGDSDSDREAPGGNPLVASFQEDLDAEDHVPSKPPLGAELVPSQNVALLSEEESGEEPEARLSTVAEEDTDPEPGAKRATKKSSKFHKPVASIKAADLMAPTSFPAPLGLEPGGSTQLPVAAAAPGTPAPVAVAAAAARPPNAGPQSQASVPKQKRDKQEESESDPEGPIATQMLSFVMDDPDFESEESDNQRKRSDEFPVREDLSDISDEEAPPNAPPAAKPVLHSFKPKNDSDLFGLGLVEPGPRGSSEEDKPSSKEKKTKKKKKKSGKEEEEKAAAKKKSKPKKSREQDEGKDEKERKRKKKQPRGRERSSEIDELEAFLGGRAGAGKQQGGGDYEEL
ncbi:Rab-like protein 6 [Varanus komodoensis]|uniref:rab-like protein 6 isoform X2 n=1 Tax=Varanus komodoensis TaxID=61221 RepID=UPI001CF7C1A6|nr:rab-like protein 6 isoform X2 [Varanus komodoensis]KAF7240998.1 Rab-like protein 6 [Varanus komodoensis]